MTQPAISVKNLGKRYRIGQRVAYHTLRETLAGAFKAPLRGSRARRTSKRISGPCKMSPWKSARVRRWA